MRRNCPPSRGAGSYKLNRMKQREFLLLIGLVSTAASRLQAASPVLVWSDEFNQPASSGPDGSKWIYDLGTGEPTGWGNNELETYTDSRTNSFVAGDPAATDGYALVIRAVKSDSGYTSARIKTRDTFQYVRFETRARIPSGAGCWPAFWALGGNLGAAGWPGCGEIDVMEWIGKVPGRIKGSLHAPGYSGNQSLNADVFLPNGAIFGEAGYHVFAADWYPDEIVFSMDGVVYEDRKKEDIPAGSKWPFDHPFQVILNFAVGGGWPGPPDSNTVFPQEYRVDYVRVYSLPANPPANLVWPPSPPSNPIIHPGAQGEVTISWTAPSSTFGAPLVGYILQHAADPGFKRDLATLSLGTATHYTDRPHGPGAANFYRVFAMTTDGRSEASTVVSTPTR
jgi:beta-glucanase (GH16 family)